MDGLRRFLWTPFGWFAFLMLELVVFLILWRWIVPGDTPAWIGFVLLVALLGAVGSFNLWFRRRFLPWDDRS